MVGPWCFLDHFGPGAVRPAGGMRVGPHPHIGLQTVTWLLEGEVLHRDSLGVVQRIRPGQLNWMTAGRGIAHSEESPADAPGVLHGVQLWVALPDEHRAVAPAFVHHPELPTLEVGTAHVTLLAGTMEGATSPAHAYHPMIGFDAVLTGAGVVELPLDPTFEHAVLVVHGAVDVFGSNVGVGVLAVLAPGRRVLRLAHHSPARVVVVGGAPFGEDILMWWNFVARSRDELVDARRSWETGDGRFGEVRGWDGPSLIAPPL